MQILNKKLKIQNKSRKLKAESCNLKAIQHQNSFSKKKNFDAGFTLLFAALIGSLVFTIGISILNVSLKQLALTNAGRESQQAFYSADAGVECALFLDRGAGQTDCQTGFFGVASSTLLGKVAVCGKDAAEYSPSSYQSCFGSDITIERVPITVTYNGVSYLAARSKFDLLESNDNDICFSVLVTKVPNPSNPNDIADMQTAIESRGYSTCNTGTNNVYERAIKTYNF